jgi:hypothetical protein
MHGGVSPGACRTRRGREEDGVQKVRGYHRPWIALWGASVTEAAVRRRYRA